MSEPDDGDREDESGTVKLIPFPEKDQPLPFNVEDLDVLIARLKAAQDRTNASLAEYRELLVAVERELGVL